MILESIPATPGKISLISYLVIFGFAMHCVARGIVLTEIIEEFDLTFTTSGALFSAGMLAYLFMTSMSGKASQMLGQRIALSVYIGILSISGTVMFFVNSIPLLFVLFVFSGACYGGIDTTATSLVSRHHGQKSSIAITRLFSVYCLGGMISAVLCGSLIYFNVGWRYSYIVIATVCLLAFCSTLLINDRGPAGTPPVEFAQFNRLLANRPFVFSCIAIAITSGTETSTMNWMTTFLTRGASINILLSSLYTSLFFFTIYLGRNIMVSFIQRYDHYRMATFSSLLSGTLSILVSFINSPNIMVFTIVLFGLSVSCLYPLMLSITINLSSENLAVSFIFSMISLGIFGIMMLTGIAADITGIGGAFRVNGLLFLAAPLLINYRHKSRSKEQ